MKAIKLLATCGLLLGSFAANAALLECYGDITRSYISDDGTVYIKSTWKPQDYTAMCNVSQDRLGVNPEVCKGWLTYITTSIVTKKKVVVTYANVSSCTEIPAYGGSPKPTYIMLMDQ